MVNPKILLAVGAAVLLLSSAIAIFFAAGYSPESGSRGVPAAPVITETSTAPLQPPPPPIMLPEPNPQVPCMGMTGDGCRPSTPTTPQPAPAN